MPCYSRREDSKNISALTDAYKFNFENTLRNNIRRDFVRYK